MDKQVSHPRVPRLAIVSTHPIQYQAPLWRELAGRGDLSVKVFYAHPHGSIESFDPLYGKAFVWDLPLMEGYEYEILPRVKLPGLAGPTACFYPLGLKKKLAEGKFDAVLIHGYMNGASWAGYWAALQIGLPILMRGDTHRVGREKTNLKSRLKDIILRRFLKRISYCIAIGTWNRNYWLYYKVRSERVVTSLYSIDNERFSNAIRQGGEESRALREQWKASVHDMVFCFSGNLQPHKGVDVLIKAFLGLSNKRDNVHLVIVGEGPEKNALQKLCQDNYRIHWTGFVNQSKIPVYLAAADMFVLPSYADAWGLVVNEAMACGLPCIVSDAVGAGPDLISLPGTGSVFPAGDSQSLATKMEQACDTSTRARWKAAIPAILTQASFRHNAETISVCVYDCVESKSLHVSKF